MRGDLGKGFLKGRLGEGGGDGKWDNFGYRCVGGYDVIGRTVDD